ncbi:MAG TPA: 7-cyano-7-deazaguanine synthase [Phycisphaerales bacterium]|nr:7-cyano-7-deazaguanine synthase [Phycisphaerales bacterium]
MSEPQSPTGLVPSCLIIADGSIATLAAVWREAVCRPGGGGGVGNAKPSLWAPSNLAPHAAAANARFVKLAGLPSIVTGPLPATTAGLSASLMLLAAGEDAAKRGIGRVVWPVQFAASDDATRLTQVGGAFDRALLAARLLSIDTRQTGGQSVLIHTPFAELNDNQLLDLAADMDAPVGAAWWCEKQADAQQPPCGGCAPCLRWLSAMRHAGIAGPIAHLPSALLEDKPAVKTAV